MRIAALFPIMALLTGCAARKPVHIVAKTQTLGARAADFVNQAQDVVKTYRDDVRAAKYEQDEINKVQADLDAFNTDAPESELWTEIDQLVADLEAMNAKDDAVYRRYFL